MAVYRLRELWPEYDDRLQIAWRTLALEIKNQQSTPKNIVDVEIELMAEQQPGLPIGPWRAPVWCYPVTLLPAFEALHCAAAQGNAQAWEFSWRLRAAFFAESRVVSMRHVLFEVARESQLDVDRFRADWDSGTMRAQALAESHHGWEDLKVPGSPTFVLPSGRQIHNPAATKVRWGPDYSIETLEPFRGDWRAEFRRFLDDAARGQ